MADKYPVPLPNAYWVIPGRFLAGEYPGAINEQEARLKIGNLLGSSIDAFLDLTMPDELLPYEQILVEEAGNCRVEPVYRRMSIYDLSIPSIEEMNAILDEIDALLEQNHNIYLHCWGGIGRTGTVVSCYLVRHGLDGQAALKELQCLRQGASSARRPSPETIEQRRFVMQWKLRGEVQPYEN